MDVNLASHAQNVPQVGCPQIEPVTIDIKQKVKPMGAILLNNINAFLNLNKKFKIVRKLITEKHARAIQDAGTCTYIIRTEWP